MGGCYKPKKENVVKLKKYLTKDKKTKRWQTKYTIVLGGVTQ